MSGVEDGTLWMMDWLRFDGLRFGLLRPVLRSLRMYNSLVEKCFSTCVQSFRRKTLEKDEERVRAPPQLLQDSIPSAKSNLCNFPPDYLVLGANLSGHA